MTSEEINVKYRNICLILGDIEVKLKGLNNQKDQLFKELEELDQQAEKLNNEAKNT